MLISFFIQDYIPFFLKSLQCKLEDFHKFTLVYIDKFIKIILKDFSKMN